MRKQIFILRSILASGNAAAYNVLWLKALQAAALPADLALAAIEGEAEPEGEEEPPIVFVVGIHRSGSTFLAQALAGALPLMPLSNLAAVFPRSRRIVHRAAGRCYRPRGGERPRNFYGYATGLFGVSDCYELWDRWMGADHYTFQGPLPAEARAAMRRYFLGLHRAYGRPILAKNNRNLLAMTELAELFPRSFFVVSRRDSVAVVASVLRANRDFFGDPAQIWGLRPSPDFPRRAEGDPVEAAGRQQAGLERVLERQVAALPGERVSIVDYEAFCASPRDHLELLNARIAGVLDLPAADLADCPPETGPSLSRLDADLRRRIEDALERGRREAG